MIKRIFPILVSFILFFNIAYSVQFKDVLFSLLIGDRDFVNQTIHQLPPNEQKMIKMIEEKLEEDSLKYAQINNKKDEKTKIIEDTINGKKYRINTYVSN
jgi:hypothetical protein